MAIDFHCFTPAFTSSMIRFASSLPIMYSSDDVVFALNKYLSSLTDADVATQLDYFLDIMLLIRKDMCGKSKISRDDILLNIMQDKGEMQKFKKMKRNNIIT